MHAYNAITVKFSWMAMTGQNIYTYLILHIPVACKPLEHQLPPNDHHTQFPTLPDISPLYLQSDLIPQPIEWLHADCRQLKVKYTVKSQSAQQSSVLAMLRWLIFMVVVFLKNQQWMKTVYWKDNKRCWCFGCYAAAIIRAILQPSSEHALMMAAA